MFSKVFSRFLVCFRFSLGMSAEKLRYGAKIELVNGLSQGDAYGRIVDRPNLCRYVLLSTIFKIENPSNEGLFQSW